jgi:hypothetical protein
MAINTQEPVISYEEVGTVTRTRLFVKRLVLLRAKLKIIPGLTRIPKKLLRNHYCVKASLIFEIIYKTITSDTEIYEYLIKNSRFKSVTLFSIKRNYKKVIENKDFIIDKNIKNTLITNMKLLENFLNN